MIRFTAWLSESERDALEDVAKEYGTSQNYIVRVAIRQFLGLDLPDTQMAQQRITSLGPPRQIGPMTARRD